MSNMHPFNESVMFPLIPVLITIEQLLNHELKGVIFKSFNFFVCLCVSPQSTGLECFFFYLVTILFLVEKISRVSVCVEIE